jgi:hypothetical protein
MDKLTSYATINDIDKLNINKDKNLVSIVRYILTDRIIHNFNITVDELFMLIIGTITSITIFLKHYYLFDNDVDKDTQTNIDEIYYSMNVLQIVVIIMYVFYLIVMILDHKNYFVINRISLVTNYIISIITLSVFLYTNYYKK